MIGRYAMIGAILNIFLGLAYLKVKYTYWIIITVWLVLQAILYHTWDYSPNFDKHHES